MMNNRRRKKKRRGREETDFLAGGKDRMIIQMDLG